MDVQINIMLFLIEALATNKKIEKDIAKLYNKHKYKAYKLAKESEYYNHPIICDGDISKEVAGKRILGLILLSQENEEVSETIMNLIKKGWLKLYNYIVNRKEIEILEISKKFYNPKMTDDEVNAILTITLFVSKVHNIIIIQDEHYNFAINLLYRRLKHYEESSPERFSYNTLSKELKEKAKSIVNRFLENYIIIKTTQNIYDIKEAEMRKFVDTLSMLFDTEDMMFLSLTSHMEVTGKDLEEIAALYYMLYKNQNREESAKFIITGIFIKYMIKAYKEIKDFYFKNNKETLYIELEELEYKIKKYEEEYSKLESVNNDLRNEIDRLRNEYKQGLEKRIIHLEKQIIEQQEEIRTLKENEKELYALRELAFELEHEYKITQKKKEVPAMPVLIVGGHENWRRKLQEELPGTYRFLDGFTEGFDIKILDGVEYVFFYTSYMNHGVYYKIINYCKKRDIKIKYIKSTSIELVKNEIAEKIRTHKA